MSYKIESEKILKIYDDKIAEALKIQDPIQLDEEIRKITQQCKYDVKRLKLKYGITENSNGEG
ncbi:MAG: hypothetical protein IJ168_09075 [Eubacterium sp.]|nr:hypothetical protein [Eubacterium sp.]